MGYTTPKYTTKDKIRKVSLASGKLSALFYFLVYTDTEKSCEASLSVLYYIYFVRNVHFSTKNVDNLPHFAIVVHGKCGQVSCFYKFPTLFVDKLKIFHTLIMICGISNGTEYIFMEKIWIARFKGIRFDAFSYMCDIL